MENPATKCLYFGLTIESAWNTIYLHMIEVLCRQFNIKIDVNLTQKTITFDNKSFIKITGADANDKQIDKALGGKYKIVIFDECQAINHDLGYWIKNKLSPAMVDLDGTICMVGTAGNLMGERFWYKVTKQDGGREPGWSVHSWNRFDNPFMADKIKKYLDEQIALDKDFETSQEYQQEWLCNWIIETSGRIYKYDPERNGIKLQDLPSHKFKYIFGMDYGFEDDTSLVVGGFYEHDPCCYIIDSMKKPKMLTQEIAELIIEWKQKYNPIFIVGDCQNKTLIETLRMQYRIAIVPARKLGKEAHWAAMNSDFRTSKIKVVEANNRALIKEWNELNYNEKQRLLGNFKENPTNDNHLADAALYLHHASKHYRVTPAPPPDLHPMRTIAEKRLEDANNLQYNETSMDIYEQFDTMNLIAEYKSR